MNSNHQQLGAFATVFVGVPTKSKRRGGARELAQVLSVRALDGGGMGVEDLQEVELFGKITERNSVMAGDVLLPSRSTSLKVGVVPPELEGAAINSTLIGVRCLPTLDPRLLAAFINHPDGEAQILNVSQSGTFQLNITAKALATIEVPIPPLETQQKLAELLAVSDRAYHAAREAAESRRRLAREMTIARLTQ